MEISEIKEIYELKKIKKNNYLGYIYVIEYGKYIKIGCSKKIFNRIKTLKRNAEKYGEVEIGRIAISNSHTNYFENEKKIHKLFEKYRKDGTELFDLNFKKALQIIRNQNIKCLDESEEMEKNVKENLNFIRNFLELGGK